MGNKAEQTIVNATEGREIKLVDLSILDFDPRNPRFGVKGKASRTQQEILDFIVQDFGIDDVISSIAVNGYFLAEPLICREQTGGRLTVMEGNRRLAACLILNEDPRAKGQSRKRSTFLQLQSEANRPSFQEVPVIIFGEHEQERDLLSYLGVRHIAASQGWDSYAKANWIARAVSEASLSLKEISTMTGDQHNTVQRLLEGYYFINQLIDSGEFAPGDSLRKGRGSNPEFPFSWIYTLFYYQKAKNFIGLPETPCENPIPKERVKDSAMLINRMFGNKTLGQPAAIDDSRKIGNLAAILDDPEKVALLKRGESVESIEFSTLPIAERLRTGLADCKDILSDLVSALDATPPSDSVAESLLSLSKQVNNLSSSLLKKLVAIQFGSME